MKLFIQIPCFNEAETLPVTVQAIKDVDFSAELPGVQVELMVVDDGSSDNTAEKAKELGVDHVVIHSCNRGLAAAFRSGVSYALDHGADVIVNTDGDNQYCAMDIPALVRPVLEGKADLVVGCRPIIEHKEFSPLKKMLQLLGSWTLRKISKTTVRDAASGFRAFSRETCMRIFIHSKFSYCMETLIQAGNSGMRVASVDIRVNRTLRPSRLFKSIPQYICKSGGTMLSMFILYRPGRFFLLSSLPFWLFSLIIGFRALYMSFSSGIPLKQFMPSYFLLMISATVAVIMCALSLIGELLKAQRKISEEQLYLQRQIRFNRKNADHQQ